VHNRIPPKQQQTSAAVNTAMSSSIVNVAAPGHPNNGKFLTNTTTCHPVDRSSSAQSAPAGLHIDLFFSSLEEDATLSEQIADCCAGTVV
jgi:hypothetical protein